MATELQQLGTFLGTKFDDIYDGVTSVGNASKLNGQTADQIKNSIITTLLDGVSEDGNTLSKLRGLIAGLQELINGDDVNLDSIKEIADYIKANKELIDSITDNKANKAEVYSKAEMDAIIDLLAVADDVYLKTETYSKSDLDNKFSLKANAEDVYNKSDVISLLDTKVNLSSVKSAIDTSDDNHNLIMTEIDVANAIAGKANTAYVNSELAKKIDLTSTKTAIDLSDDNKNLVMTEIDVANAIAGKANASDVATSLDTKVNHDEVLSDTSDTNKITTQDDVSLMINNAVAPLATINSLNAGLDLKIDKSVAKTAIDPDSNLLITESDLNAVADTKADKTNTYTKDETYTKTEVLAITDQIGTYAQFVDAFNNEVNDE